MSAPKRIVVTFYDCDTPVTSVAGACLHVVDGRQIRAERVQLELPEPVGQLSVARFDRGITLIKPERCI